jgi:hypothetical protein
MGLDGSAVVDRFAPWGRRPRPSGSLSQAVVAGFAPVFEP